MNTIEIQDKYVATVSRVALTNRNYYTVVTKATGVARKAATDIGLTITEAERLIQDAHDMVNLVRAAVWA